MDSYRVLLPAWGMAVTAVGVAATFFGWIGWTHVLCMFVACLVLTVVWLQDQRELLEYIRPNNSVSIWAVPREARSALSELVASFDRYATVTQNLGAAVLVRDNQGHITYCNPYTEVLFGLSRDSIIASKGAALQEIIAEEDQEKHKNAHVYSLVGEPFLYRHKFMHCSGTEMWAETRVMPLLDSSGQVVASLSIMVDVTQTVKYEEQLSRLNTDLKDFTYMVSHDLRAPLVTVGGVLKHITGLIEAHGDDTARELLNHALQAVSRLEILTRSVIDYAQIGSHGIHLEKINALPILKDALRTLAPQADAINARIELPHEEISLLGSAIPLSQIFSNLIENFIKYHSPHRQPLLIIAVAPNSAPGQLSLTFKDNGIGIPEDKQQDIFRPFLRAHPSVATGSGIGLACVQKLAELLHGHIELISSDDSGSCFGLTFKTQ